MVWTCVEERRDRLCEKKYGFGSGGHAGERLTETGVERGCKEGYEKVGPECWGGTEQKSVEKERIKGQTNRGLGPGVLKSARGWFAVKAMIIVLSMPMLTYEKYYFVNSKMISVKIQNIFMQLRPHPRCIL